MTDEKQDEYDYEQTKRLRISTGKIIRNMQPTCRRKEMSPHRLTLRFAKRDLIGAWQQLRSHEVCLKKVMRRNKKRKD
jgi:hypothetical protein